MTHSLSILGADVSSLQHALDLGAKYFYKDGTEGDPLQILKDHGINYARLRVWVNPANSYNNQEKIIQFAPFLKKHGLKLLIDFHYSDTWADPAHQIKPAKWAKNDFQRLQKELFDHTYEVVKGLKEIDIIPEMVQIGNEINPGMLLPDGSVFDWKRLALLLSKGYDAVKSCSSKTLVMLHIANAGDKKGAREWFDNAQAHGVQWDVTGLSYYSYWHGSISDMAGTVEEMKKQYGKPVIIAETAYPFTLEDNDGERNSIYSEAQLASDFPATPAGQASNLRAVLNAARDAGATGVFYWEPTWIAIKGNGWDPNNPASGSQWENQALFDYAGKALPAMSEFKP